MSAQTVSPVAQVTKALVAAGVATVGALGTSLADGSLTVAELAISVSAGLAAAVLTYNATNQDPPVAGD